MKRNGHSEGLVFAPTGRAGSGMKIGKVWQTNKSLELKCYSTFLSHGAAGIEPFFGLLCESCHRPVP